MSSRPRIVFISYAHEDGPFVNSLAAVLQMYDMNVWKDAKDIPIGANILKDVYEGIKNASHFCCIVSAHSIRSAWVEDELSFARMRQLDGRGLAIVPVLIDEVEIPDYVKAYRCAHLENRDLSLQNNELLLLLKAFGTDLQVYLRTIITGPERRNLLKRCADLRYALSEFRNALGRLQAASNERRSAHQNRGYDPPPRRSGAKKSSAPYRPTTYGSDYRIRQATKRIASVMDVAKNTASAVRDAMDALDQARKAADPSESIERLGALLHLDPVSYMLRSVAAAPDDGDVWWLGQKLSEWVTNIPSEEAYVGAAMALLKSWASFDPPGEPKEEEDDLDDVESEELDA